VRGKRRSLGWRRKIIGTKAQKGEKGRQEGRMQKARRNGTDFYKKKKSLKAEQADGKKSGRQIVAKKRKGGRTQWSQRPDH